MTLPPPLNDRDNGLFPLKDFQVESSKILRKQRTVCLYSLWSQQKELWKRELKVAHMHSSLDQQQYSVSRKNYLVQLKAVFEAVLATLRRVNFNSCSFLFDISQLISSMTTCLWALDLYTISGITEFMLIHTSRNTQFNKKQKTPSSPSSPTPCCDVLYRLFSSRYIKTLPFLCLGLWGRVYDVHTDMN